MKIDSNWFQQDGAPIHTSKLVTTYFNRKIKRKWIAIKPHRLFWPPYSPDLSPLDFFLWDYVNDRVSSRNPTTIEQLKKFIDEELNKISPKMISNACMSVSSRCQTCIERGSERVKNY